MTDIKSFYSQEILKKALPIMGLDKFVGKQKPKEYNWLIGWIRRILRIRPESAPEVLMPKNTGRINFRKYGSLEK